MKAKYQTLRLLNEEEFEDFYNETKKSIERCEKDYLKTAVIFGRLTAFAECEEVRCFTEPQLRRIFDLVYEEKKDGQ